jgi:hypothetical protein
MLLLVLLVSAKVHLLNLLCIQHQHMGCRPVNNAPGSHASNTGHVYCVEANRCGCDGPVFVCVCACCRVFGGSSSFSIIESMQQVVVDIRIYLLYLLLMVRLNPACIFGGGGIVTRRHVRSQQEWHCLPRWEPTVNYKGEPHHQLRLLPSCTN